MSAVLVGALRQRLRLAGGHPARHSPHAVIARGDEPRIRIAEVVEPPLRAIRCPAATPWDEPVAFMDGIQRSQLLGNFGIWPVISARVAAGIRLRTGRRLSGVVHLVRELLIGPGAALAAMGDLTAGVELVPLDVASGLHPLAFADQARAEVDRARTALEIGVVAQFRGLHRAVWLLIDGSLTVSPEWATDPKMIGLVKSHTTLPFEGQALERYLTMPVGHRSSAYKPPSRTVTPIHAFGLRLRDWRGHDLLHGLVRVERPATAAALAEADQIAAHLMAERAPVAADPRSDRLLYGVHAVERWLGSLG